tara:strand:- start:6432 stop:7001 length:570 start_codon:yes stop_codon:yes gene_type:complete
MSYENRKWVVMTLEAINAGDKYETQSVPDEDGELVEQEVLVGNTYIESAIESSKATLRRSLDGSKTILKWDGETPEVFEGMDTYTHAEILEELAGPAWTSNEEPGQAAVSSQSYVKYRAKSSAQERLAEFPEGHGITALRSTKTFGGSAIILSNESQRQYLNAEELEDLEPVGDEEWVEWLAKYEPEAP